jgi:hypothetical protein
MPWLRPLKYPASITIAAAPRAALPLPLSTSPLTATQSQHSFDLAPPLSLALLFFSNPPAALGVSPGQQVKAPTFLSPLLSYSSFPLSCMVK